MANLKDEDKIITIPDLDYVPDERGTGFVFFTHMRKHQDKVAQVDALTGEKETYSSLLERSIRTAITMRSKGITSNHIVSFCTYNSLDSIVPYVATHFLGAIAAALDPYLNLDDTVHLLKQVTPKMIFVIPEAEEMIEKAMKRLSADTEIVVFGETEANTKFSDFLMIREEDEINFKPVTANSLLDTNMIHFSSGTSGMPKGICLNHLTYLSQIANAWSFGLDFTMTLGFASLYWVTNPLLWGICIMYGKTRLIVPKFDPIIVWEAIRKFQPTFMFIAPSQILALHAEAKAEAFDSDCLKDICIGGRSLSKEQMLEMKKMFPKSRTTLGYGQTEAIGFICCFKRVNSNEINWIPNKPTSSGPGVPGVSYKVVDPETEELLGPNREGELRIKTKFQMNGYYNLDSTDAWDGEGWLRTGDVVYYDEDKCFYVIDRIKEMLKFQSWHIPPAVVENVILTHPAIKHAVVIGVPHEIDGEHPMAVIELNDGYVGKIEPKDIEKYVEDKVHDRQRLRGGVKIVDCIPVTPSGKVNRKGIKNMVLLV